MKSPTWLAWRTDLHLSGQTRASQWVVYGFNCLFVVYVYNIVTEHRTSVSHFYSGGDVCDKTGKPRQTEVKLKCLENSSSPAQVSLYLLEPRTCHYILGVESPLICDILPLANENGLIKSVSSVLKRQDNVVEPKEEDSDTKHKHIVKYGND